jgi:hypothetical protein
MADRHPIWQLADQLQMDLRAASAKLVELRAQLASIDLGDTNAGRVTCPTCTATFSGDRTLAEHAYNVHDGPVPPHYEAIEARSLEPQEEPA